MCDISIKNSLIDYFLADMFRPISPKGGIKMNKYEMLFILSPSISDEEKDAIIAKFSNIIEEKGGKVANVDKWGIKKLAYPIKFKTEGFYVLMNFESTAEASQYVDRLMLITDNVLRCLIVRK